MYSSVYVYVYVYVHVYVCVGISQFDPLLYVLRHGVHAVPMVMCVCVYVYVYVCVCVYIYIYHSSILYFMSSVTVCTLCVWSWFSLQRLPATIQVIVFFDRIFILVLFWLDLNWFLVRMHAHTHEIICYLL